MRRGEVIYPVDGIENIGAGRPREVTHPSRGFLGLALLPLCALLSVSPCLADTPTAAPASGDSARTILFFGDSLTSGYGLGREQAYPALVQARIDSLGWNFRVVNAGLDGETSAAGLRRVDWVLRRPVDVFVLELGGNDGLRGLPLQQTESNLAAILARAKEKNPGVELVIAGMQLPPNLGPDYTGDFRDIFPRLAEKSGALLIPFLLEGVGGDPELMFSDGIHPNAAGHARVAAVVWASLEPLLRRLAGESNG